MSDIGFFRIGTTDYHVASDAIRSTAQSLTNTEKEQARANISAAAETTARDVVFTTPSFSSLPQTYTDSQVTFQGSVTHITPDLYLTKYAYECSNENAMIGSWNIDFDTEGRVTISGSISGTTNITLFCRHK